MFIQENIKTKIADKYDVAVCGGGFAGISAALAAARRGSRTILFEREYILGGLGTAGIVTIYLPLCDGMGRQVSFGIAEELFRLSVKDGAEDRYPENWLDGVGTRTKSDKRFEVQYNPQLFAVNAEQLLLDAGVDIMYGSYAVGTDVQDGKIKHIIIENKSGRQAYEVRSVVDATGDCDIALFAGAPTDTYSQGNSLAAWYYSAGESGYKLNMVGYLEVSEEEENNAEKAKTFVNRTFSGTDAGEISEMMCLSHKSTYNDFLRKRASDPQVWPVTMATIPQLRMTRKILGGYELDITEEHKYFEDSIGMVSNWRRRGPVYEVPFATLYSPCVKNLICAGRCTSVTQAMWDIMRVIPCCAVTGEAAGTAAAMTDDFGSLDVSELQKVLVSNGVVLHEKDI